MRMAIFTGSKSNEKDISMNKTYDWSNFYNALCKIGPRLLIGIDDATRELIAEFSSSSDIFWSDGLQDPLERNAPNGDMQMNVLLVLEMWRENVLDSLDSSFGIELDWELVCINDTSPIIDELVEAASPG